MKSVNTIYFEHAINELMTMFPEEAGKLDENRELILKCIINEDENAKQLLQEVTFSSMPEAQAREEFNSCEEAIGVVVLDAMIFVLGLMGIHIPFSDKLAKAITLAIRDDIRKIVDQVAIISDDNSTNLEKAQAIWQIVTIAFAGGAFDTLVDHLRNEMTWYEWAVFGVKLMATIALIFATGGAAIIAKILFSLVDAVDLIRHAIHAMRVCTTEG